MVRRPVSVGVLTVSDTRNETTDTSGQYIVSTLEEAGHHVVKKLIVKDSLSELGKKFGEWIDDPAYEVIISTGGTGLTFRDITPEALQPYVTKEIPGFGEMFRYLSIEEIGTSTIQSRAMGALCKTTYAFLLPGSGGAVRLGMQKILLPQLDIDHKPCNLVELLPRIHPV